MNGPGLPLGPSPAATAAGVTLGRLLELVVVLTQKELKVRYNSHVFGYLWSVLQPLSFALVFLFAFRVVMRVKIVDDYPLFLLTGLFPWQWFSNSINASAMTFLGNASIIKKLCFPRYTLVIAHVLQDAIHFVLSLPVLLGFLLLRGHVPGAVWAIGIPLFLAAQAALLGGLCLAVASVNLFFRDFSRVTSILVSLLFYGTPILYPADMIPSSLGFWIHLNPMTDIVIGWRELFLYDRLEGGTLGICALQAAICLAGGAWIYSRLSHRFAEVL
jgi:lipopolysaccharide transport system permease protein